MDRLHAIYLLADEIRMAQLALKELGTFFGCQYDYPDYATASHASATAERIRLWNGGTTYLLTHSQLEAIASGLAVLYSKKDNGEIHHDQMSEEGWLVHGNLNEKILRELHTR